jgi:general L-amino acid transport system permease protein
MFEQTPIAHEPYPAPEPAQPDLRLAPREWVRLNLFGSTANAVITVVFGVVLAWVAYRALRFVFVTADWEIVRRNLLNFMLGRFPRDELWRPWASLYVLAATFGVLVGAAGRMADRGHPRDLRSLLQRAWPPALLLVAILALTTTLGPTLLVLGAVATGIVARALTALAPRGAVRFAWLLVLIGLVAAFQVIAGFGGVGWDKWGGLQLTLFVTVAGIVLAFPLGLLLALGRRSTLPVVRAFSVGYIEFFRGVPLITLLLMGQFMIGFFFPRSFDVPSALSRALIAIVVFEAAYVAEIVRGGLQAVPRGQYEAAQALGLSPWKMMRLIVLPQALRAVIPAMVGQFISLFKDTSLLAIIGFFEVLNVAQTVTSQPDFLGQGLHAVTLAFVGFVYWVGAYTMSKESQRLERRLGIGER